MTMAFNFPVGYQPMQNYYSQQPVQQPVNNSGIIWVQGEAGAKSYLVAPNSTVQLWDSEEQVIYLKSADASGMPSMKILDYTIRENSQPNVAKPIDTDMYATKEQLLLFRNDLNDLRKDLDKLMKKGDE